MDSLFIVNVKSLIVFMHLAGLAFGVGGAWILDLYILRKMYKFPITEENIQIINFVSKLVTAGLALLWVSGLLFIVFYNFADPASLSNQKVWAKLVIVIVLTINGYYLHETVIPILEKNQGNILIRTINLRQLNILVLVGCISIVTWPLVMFLGVFKSFNFTLSFFEIIGIYLLVLTCSLAVAFAVKSYLMEQEMNRKINVLNKRLGSAKKLLISKERAINVLSKIAKQG